jgi:hypothetical protein
LLIPPKKGLDMRITIEIDSSNELEKLSALFKAFKINTVEVFSADSSSNSIVKGNKKLDPNGLFGIWAHNPRSLEAIRKDAWKRDLPIP